MSRKSRAQQVMNEYYSKLGTGPYYYDKSAVAAALCEAVEGLNIEDRPERELSIEKHHFIRGQLFVNDYYMKGLVGTTAKDAVINAMRATK